MIATIVFVAIITTVIIQGITPTYYQPQGVIKDWFSSVTIAGSLSIFINITTIILTAVLFNKMAIQYRLIKENSLLPICFILLFLTLQPSLITYFSLPNIVTLMLGVAILILYSSYQDNQATEKCFIIGLLFAICGIFYARALYLLPIFIPGMMQMQIGSFKTFAALIIGLITPYWIIWGMGCADISQANIDALAITLQMPVFTTETLSVLFIALLGLFAGVCNLINAYNDNIKSRAMNGFINILSVYTCLIMIIDNSHYTAYYPLLCSCVALQLSYFFTSRQERTYRIIFFVLVALLISLQTWIYWIK